MGINGLNKFLKNHCHEIYEEIHISEYAFKKIAIDFSLYLCKFKTSCGENWLGAFINFVACLRRNEIHCAFIYDSGYEPEKEPERQRRALEREKNERRVFLLEESLEEYHRTGIIGENLKELYKRRKKVNKPKRLLKPEAEDRVDIRWVEDKVKKMRSYILNITPRDFELTRKLFDILDVPWYKAPLEAETMCSDLCKRGLVDAVLSDDTDVLAYGSPVNLNKLNINSDTCIRVKYDDALKGLELENDQFLDLCIMCGTDYNTNIFRVGPEKSYQYIKKFGTIDGITDNTSVDVKVLNHIRGREIFKEYKKHEIEKVPYCGKPDFEKLKEFVFKHNVRIDIDGLKSSFCPNIVIIEE